MQSVLFNKLARIGAVLALIAAFSSNVSAQTDVKIGTNPGNKTASAVLELESTTKGFLLPRMTTTEMNAVASPANGLSIYNTTTNCVYVYRSTAWYSTCDPIGLGAWSVTGNNNINPATHFLGTTTAQPIIFKTNSAEYMRLTSAGNLGLGTATPSYKLDIDAMTGAAGNPLRLQGLNAGVVADSLVTSSSGIIRRMSFADYLSNANGVTGTGVATRVAFWNSTNTLSSNANLYWDNTNGRLGIGSSSPSYKLDIDAATGGAGNPLRLQGLNAGATTDSVLTSALGIVRRLSIAELVASGFTASNGLTKTANDIALGGALTSPTTITTSATNTLALAGVQGGFGIITDSIMTMNALTGVIHRRSVADVLASGGSWLLGGNTTGAVTTIGTNDNYDFGLETNGVTRLTISNTGAITQNGTGAVTFNGAVSATGGATVTGATNINTTGAAATNIGNAASTTTVLGTTNINTTGAGVTNIGSATGTTNIDATSLNVTNVPVVTTTTSNVMLNNPATGKTESISVSNLVGNAVTADNGITKNTPTNFRLGGTLVQNTAIAQASFDMNFSGGKVAIGSASAPVSTLQVTGSQGVSYRKVTAATTLDATDYIVLANATSGVIVLTLPLASACLNRTYYIGKSDESVNTVTFSPALYLTETTTIASINYAKKFKIVSDGSNWWIYNE